MSRDHSKSWRWGVCGLLLLATMLNYMDRQTLSQSATDIGKELQLRNEDYGRLELAFGLAFAAGGIILGFVADRASLRILYPFVLLAWSAAGFATGWAKDYQQLLLCRVILGFFEAGQWPCALAASQRILSRSDRALGNSLIQSGASIGAVITPLVVQLMVSNEPGSWRGPFQVIGLLGLGWVVVWAVLIRGGDLDRIDDDASTATEFTTSSYATFLRRFLVLTVVVVTINLTWHFYRAWLPKMLREQYGYSRDSVNYFTSLYYIATDVGCLAAGYVVKLLSNRSGSVHRARVLTFLGCALLTAIGSLIPLVPAGPAMFGLLLMIGAGSLGLFPIYYSLTQELTVRHQGKVIGALLAIAWLSTSVMHLEIGKWIDRTGSYSAVLVMTGLLPLIAFFFLGALWNPRSIEEEKVAPSPNE